MSPKPPTPSSPSLADVRGAVAHAWDTAADALGTQRASAGASPFGPGVDAPPVIVERLSGTPRGVAVFRIPGDDHGVAAVLRELRHDAPDVMHERYGARVIANLTGRCPACGAAAGAPTADPAEVDALGIPTASADLLHEASCGAVFTPADARWFVTYDEGARP